LLLWLSKRHTTRDTTAHRQADAARNTHAATSAWVSRGGGCAVRIVTIASLFLIIPFIIVFRVPVWFCHNVVFRIRSYGFLCDFLITHALKGIQNFAILHNSHEWVILSWWRCLWR